MKNERLEKLSDQVRRGIPVGFGEALEVVAYQEYLREMREARWFAKVYRKIKKIWRKL